MSIYVSVLLFATASMTVVWGSSEAAAKAVEVGVKTLQEFNAMQWAQWPFLGAILASMMAFLFRSDNWKHNLGRFIGAIAMGIFLPRMVTYIHPWLKEWSVDPIILAGWGFGSGMLGFALAKWVVDYSMRRIPTVAEVQAEQWMERQELRRRRDERDGEETTKMEP